MRLHPVLELLYVALETYKWIVIISAILSWLVAFNVINTRNQFVYTVGRALHALTEPALKPIRRFLPSLGGIDISPIVVLLLIFFLQRMLLFYGPSIL